MESFNIIVTTAIATIAVGFLSEKFDHTINEQKANLLQLQCRADEQYAQMQNLRNQLGRQGAQLQNLQNAQKGQGNQSGSAQAAQPSDTTTQTSEEIGNFVQQELQNLQLSPNALQQPTPVSPLQQPGYPYAPHQSLFQNAPRPPLQTSPAPHGLTIPLSPIGP